MRLIHSDRERSSRAEKIEPALIHAQQEYFSVLVGRMPEPMAKGSRPGIVVEQTIFQAIFRMVEDLSPICPRQS
jgi:hypothetical protein